MRVYVAAASAEAWRAANIIGCLREAGLVVPYDWPALVLAEGTSAQAGGPRDPHVAKEEVRGVLSSDLHWLLAPEVASTGAGFETGIAYAIRKPIVVSGPHCSRFFFGVLMREFGSDADALAWVLSGCAREWLAEIAL